MVTFCAAVCPEPCGATKTKPMGDTIGPGSTLAATTPKTIVSEPPEPIDTWPKYVPALSPACDTEISSVSAAALFALTAAMSQVPPLVVETTGAEHPWQAIEIDWGGIAPPPATPTNVNPSAIGMFREAASAGLKRGTLRLE